MRVHINIRPSILAISIAIAFPTAYSAQIPFAQYPAGSGSIEPAPNVIISVDDSASMAADGFAALKNALSTTFSEANLPDGRVRLAWQAMNRCNGIPNSNADCGGRNSLKPLQGTHRSNFLDWVDDLAYRTNQGTPSHTLMRNAGEYLRTTGANSPWNANPGTADNSPIACRRAYHIFMTDGAWNGMPSTGYGMDGHRADGPNLASGFTAPSYTNRFLSRDNSANIDGTTTTLPDGTIYDITSDQTRVYRDDWGYSSSTPRERTRSKDRWGNWNSWSSYSSYTDANGLNTIADIAFHDWSTDLQPNIANDVSPLMEASNNVTYTNSAVSVELQPFWNPRNNPATWQSLTTYTIGFKTAANLTKPTSGADNWPTFSASTDINESTFSGEFSQIITGQKLWPTPFCGTNGNNPCESSVGSNTGRQYNDFQNPTDRDEHSDTLILQARIYELWHAAINGRGRFFPATDSDALAAAFKAILDKVKLDTSRPITSYSNSNASNANKDIYQYRAGYVADRWSGKVYSLVQSQANGALSANPGWGTLTGVPEPNNFRSSADILDALSDSQMDNRLILSTNSNTGAGISFTWDALHSTQRALLKKTNETDTKAQNRINYIRGKRNNEGSGTDRFRLRDSRQGDIVNSQIWYIDTPVSNFFHTGYSSFVNTYKNRRPMLYVGGNDGMLHGFSAENGTEKISYIPKGVISNLYKLGDTNFNSSHHYYVDGSPVTGDIDRSKTATSTTTNWKTLLTGTLGAGGRGYFVLDVTNPGTKGTDEAGNFTVANASSLVVLDKTLPATATGLTGDDADIGHIFHEPVLSDNNSYVSTQFALLNDGRWAYITGNGYNSINERPVLLIQYLSGSDTNIKSITAAEDGDNASGNGLSAPRTVDLDGNGTVDVVYAGDLKGNLWKFDLTSSSNGNWDVAFEGSPLFQAKYINGNTSQVQPITAAPMVRPNDRGMPGMQVVFGTGQNLTEDDRTDSASIQSIYSIIDTTLYKMEQDEDTDKVSIIIDTDNPGRVYTDTDRSRLVAQGIDSSDSTAKDGEGSNASRKFWAMSSNDVAYDNEDDEAPLGWYLNFPENGERLLKPMSFHDNSNVLAVYSQVPASGGSTVEEMCGPSPREEKQYLTFLNIMDGKRPSIQIVDRNGDNLYNGDDSNVSRMDFPAGAISKPVDTGNGTLKVTAGDQSFEFRQMPEQPLRPSWRQLQ